MNSVITAPTITDATAGPVVRTFAVRTKASVQWFEQGRTAIDVQLLPLLIAAVDASIDDALLNGDGTSGSLTGIRSTSNISGGTYTDASPTLAEAWPVIESTV